MLSLLRAQDRLAYPEAGACLRATGNMVLTVMKLLRRGGSAPRRLQDLAAGNGPGLNSGAELERLIGEALAARPGISADITMQQVCGVLREWFTWAVMQAVSKAYYVDRDTGDYACRYTGRCTTPASVASGA